MDALRYQGAAQHQADHRQLLAEIQHQIDDLHAGPAHRPYLLRFQENWLTHHISSQDMLLGQAILTHKGICDRRRAHPQHMTEDELDAFEDRRQGILEHIVWTSKLAVGVEVIDAEHRAIVEIYNSAIDVSQSLDRSRLRTLLEQLGNATAKHFETEEKLMVAFDYEHAAAHHKEHHDLLDEFGHQVDDWRANRISASALCRFMYRWLLRHVIVSDKPLAEAIQRQGSGELRHSAPAF